MTIKKESKTSTDYTIANPGKIGYGGILDTDGSPGKQNSKALMAAYATSPIYSLWSSEMKAASGEAGTISYDPTDNGAALKKWFFNNVVNGSVTNLNMGITNQSLEYAGSATEAAPNLASIDTTKLTGINTLSPYVPNLKSPGEGQWTDADCQPAYDPAGNDIPPDLKKDTGNGQATLAGNNIVTDSDLKKSGANIASKNNLGKVAVTPDA